MRCLQRGPTLWRGRSVRGVVVLLCTCAAMVSLGAQNLHDPRYG